MAWCPLEALGPDDFPLQTGAFSIETARPNGPASLRSGPENVSRSGSDLRDDRDHQVQPEGGTTTRTPGPVGVVKMDTPKKTAGH